jgi:GNAT superfamily N-acetyltransferase
MVTLNLRPPQRDELPSLTRIQNAANVNSALHHLMVPNQDKPGVNKGYNDWTLLRQRTRFVTPFLRFMIAEDEANGEIAGLSVWAAQGDCSLLNKWTAEVPRWWAVERALLGLEAKYHRYVTDTVVDWEFIDDFHKTVEASTEKTPPCLHLWVLEVDPKFQGKGVGKALMAWGKKLAEEEDLPLVLESNLEATGFYGKMGMKRIDDVIFMEGTAKRIDVPMFVWEYEEDRFLQNSIKEGRYRWRDSLLAKNK